jgi:hypothetical protein
MISAPEKKEVQAHGFLWERQLLTRVYGATSEEIATLSYTSPYDLPVAMNRVTKANLSIKTTGSTTICMGDALRIFDEVSAKEGPLHLTVIRYAQETPTTKRIKEIIEVNLTDSQTLLFGTATRADIEALDRLVKAVPQKRSPTPEEHAAIYALQRSLKAKLKGIYLNVKCNSQQSRLQCSFNKWAAFIAANPDRIVAKSTGASLHGGAIDETIESGPRKFA